MAAQKSIKLNEKQIETIKNLNSGIAELQGRLQAYIEGMKDAQNIPADFFPVGLDGDKLSFEQQDIPTAPTAAPAKKRGK